MKKIYSLLLLIICLPNISIGQSCIKGYYPFSGNAYDAVGSDTGTVHGAIISSDFKGNPHKAYHFNGSGDYISTPLAVPTGNNSRTVTAWFNTSDTTTNSGYGYNTIVSWGDVASNQLFAISTAQHGNIRLDGFANDMATKTFAADGKWHFIAVTHDGDTTKIFLDNILIAKKGTTYNTASSNLMIGTRINQVNQYMNGKIDEVRIYDCAITTKQIDSLYKYYISLPIYDCEIAHYPFNGNANDIKNGYNGTNFGATADSDRFDSLSHALLFDGSSNYVTTNAPVPTANDPRSVTAWFNTSDTTTNSGYGYNTIVSWGNVKSNQLFAISTAQHGNIRLDGFANDIVTNKFAADGKWHFIAVTHDGNTTKIYLDTVIIATKSTKYNTVSSNLMIGARINQTNQFMNGRIDDVRLFGCAISAKEVDSLYKNPLITGMLTQNENKSDFTLYPNPSSGSISINIKNPSGDYELRIIDILGKVITSEIGYMSKNETKSISFKNMRKGVYTIILQTKDTISAQKMIVQ